MLNELAIGLFLFSMGYMLGLSYTKPITFNCYELYSKNSESETIDNDYSFV